MLQTFKKAFVSEKYCFQFLEMCQISKYHFVFLPFYIIFAILFTLVPSLCLARAYGDVQRNSGNKKNIQINEMK